MKKKGQQRRKSAVNNHNTGKQHRGESKQEGNSLGATRQQRLLCVLKGESHEREGISISDDILRKSPYAVRIRRGGVSLNKRQRSCCQAPENRSCRVACLGRFQLHLTFDGTGVVWAEKMDKKGIFK